MGCSVWHRDVSRQWSKEIAMTADCNDEVAQRCGGVRRIVTRTLRVIRAIRLAVMIG
jgi:hypothetical protein